MNPKVLHLLITPGLYPSRNVFFAGMVAIVAIFVADIGTSAEIRLHVLYVFPLAGIALHCERIQAPFFGMTLSTAFQLLTFYHNGIRQASLVTDVLVAFVASLLIITLARATRKNYLETQNLAVTDSLTGLHNRRSFESIAELERVRQKRYGGVFSLAIIDLDNFKVLNDSQGHRAGDEALRLVAEILRQKIRKSDSAARLGGDEFAILMPNTQESEGHYLCFLLVNEIFARMVSAGYGVTASIGCTTIDQTAASMEDAFHQADQAMYAAKVASKRRSAAGL